MRLNLILLSILLSMPGYVLATGDSTHYLTPQDTIFLHTSVMGEKVFEHTLEKKQTLFSLAKFYGLSVEELYFYNPGLEVQSLKVGQKIQVPVPNRAIVRYRVQNFIESNFVPVYHIVQRGETMFRISRYYYEMPKEIIMQRNGMTSTDLKTGQALQIGWMSLDGIPEEYRSGGGGPISRRNNALRKVFARNTQGKKLTEDSGAAFWKKSTGEGSDFYALHRYAPVNSIIEINNPMKNRVIYAKVVGRIPDTAYGDDVKVIVSSVVAQLLGAKDRRFFVKIRYQK